MSLAASLPIMAYVNNKLLVSLTNQVKYKRILVVFKTVRDTGKMIVYINLFLATIRLGKKEIEDGS